MNFDKTVLQIFANYCVAAAESMAHTLMRTAHSAFVKETGTSPAPSLTPRGQTFASPRRWARPGTQGWTSAAPST